MRRSVFLRCLLFYLLFLLVLMGMYVPLYRLNLNMIAEKSVQVSETMLYSRLKQFEYELSQTRTLHAAVRRRGAYAAFAHFGSAHGQGCVQGLQCAGNLCHAHVAAARGHDGGHVPFQRRGHGGRVSVLYNGRDVSVRVRQPVRNACAVAGVRERFHRPQLPVRGAADHHDGSHVPGAGVRRAHAAYVEFQQQAAVCVHHRRIRA